MSSLLEISDVSKAFGGVQAVTRVSMDVRKGEILSVIGPNGAGKTTLLNMISGFYHPDTGRITLEGEDITQLKPSKMAERGVARTFQNIALFRGMTVLDNLMLGRHVRMRSGVFASFVYWGLAQKEEVAHRRRVEDIIDFLKIQDLAAPTGLAGLRPSEAGRAGARAGARSQDPPPRRAHGGLQPRGEGGHGALHPRCEPGVGDDDYPHRARHGGGDGHLRPGRGAGHGAKDCPGHPRRGAREPPGDQGLPGRGQARGARRSRRRAERTGVGPSGARGTLPQLPRLLQRNARDFGNRPAIREKDRGIWQTWTWREYHDQVPTSPSAWRRSGFHRGDRLSVIGDNRPRLYWAQVAAQCLGGVPVPVYQDSIAKELAFVWNHAEISVIVAEDQEQVDKVLALREQLPGLRLVIYDDPRGMGAYRARLAQVLRARAGGRPQVRRASTPAISRPRSTRGGRRTSRIISYTSGTTGNPKGAMISHANAIGVAESFAAGGAAQAGGHVAGLSADGVGGRLGLHALREPHGGVLRQLSREPGDGAAGSARAGPLDDPGPAQDLGEHAHLGPGARRRRLAAQAPDLRVLPRGGRARRDPARRRQARAPRDCVWPPALGEFFVYGPVRDQLGLRQAKWALTGGAPLGPDTFRFFRSIGVNLKQVYGSTETTGLVLDAARHRGQSHHRRTPGARRRGQDRRAGRGARARLRRVPGLSQERGGHARGHRSGRVVPHRGRRLHRPPRAPGHHRPRQGRRRPRRRHAVRPSVHREQAQVQPVHPRGGGLRQRPAVRDGDGRHRPRHGGQLGRAPGPRVHLLHGRIAEGGDARADPRGDREGELRRCRRRPRSAASCC